MRSGGESVHEEHIDQQVSSDDEQDADDQRQGQIAACVFDLSRRPGHIFPPVIGKDQNDERKADAVE